MTSSTIRHQPTRSTATLGIAGQAGWSPLRAPTDIEAALAVRRYALTELPGRTVTAGTDPDRTTLTWIRARFPTAEETFGRPALLALTRRPTRGVCGFCRATVTAAVLSEPAPSPASPVLQALLGRPCRRCQERQRTTDHLAAVRAACRVEQGLLDEGDVPALAARIGYWGQLLGVPGAIKGAALADALHPRRPARPARPGRPTGRITTVGGVR
jgi:hypothetical protein